MATKVSKAIRTLTSTAEEARKDTKRPPRGCTTGCELGPLGARPRADASREVRVAAADFERAMKIAPHPCNGDEVRYQNRHFFASFTKGLPHDPKYGEVDPAAYCELLKALSAGKPPKVFEKITLGCPSAAPAPGAVAAPAYYEQTSRFAPATAPAPVQRRLVDPQAALAFDLEGPDSHQLGIPAAPRFDSAEEAAEMVELYWQALARDVPFTDYGSEPITKAAIDDLNALGSAFSGPKNPMSGKVTGRTLFRGFTPGDLAGPYISQFMLRDVPFGAQRIDPRISTAKPGIDYMTDFKKWLLVQNGCTPAEMDEIDPQARYIRNGRDIGHYVHIDVLYQAYFNAMLILLTPKKLGGIEAPFDAGNPYTAANSKTQEGFGTFGGPQIATLVAEVSTRALKAVWFQKWAVHRRLRPEAFGGRTHLDLTGVRDYPIHESLKKSKAVQAVKDKYGTYFLPMAFPEGSPIHPAYGAGHATVAGACVTILKAWFDGSCKLKDLGVTPMVPKADGLKLEPYTGKDKDDLTIDGELNKLAANVAIGRDHAGVHWRTDYTASVRLGEQVAIKLLEDSGFTYNESFEGFTLTTFDGQKLTKVGKKRKP